MYYPYFRGKQYELITLREMANVLTNSKIVPILESVKENHAGLEKCILELKKYTVPFIFVINPKHGDFKNNNETLVDFIEKNLKTYDKLQIGYIVDVHSNLVDVTSALSKFKDYKICLIHYGFPDAASLSADLKAKNIAIETNVYIEEHCRILYRKHFKGVAKKTVLVRDGFKKVKNSAYPEDEIFSELHLTYEDENVNAFGDFLTVGDDYSESGGPAYAIAIHLTYTRKDGVMNIKHFISDRTDSPVDPAGKFLEALGKLYEEVSDTSTLILETEAVKEYKQLYTDAHFPGLGYIKKMSMKHHLELMLNFLK